MKMIGTKLQDNFELISSNLSEGKITKFKAMTDGININFEIDTTETPMSEVPNGYFELLEKYNFIKENILNGKILSFYLMYSIEEDKVLFSYSIVNSMNELKDAQEQIDSDFVTVKVNKELLGKELLDIRAKSKKGYTKKVYIKDILDIIQEA